MNSNFILILLAHQLLINFAFVHTNGDTTFVDNSSHVNSFNQNALNEPYCITTPQKLNFCSKWGSFMRMPNLVGHKTTNELIDAMSSSLFPIHELTNVQCKASEQLKLLVCATMSPICLDLIIPPCRHLCMTAKSSCRLALQREHIEWPKFLDCRKFPRGPENCIGRQPPLLINESVTNQDVVHHGFNRNVTSIKRRRKDKKDGKLTTNGTQITTIENLSTDQTVISSIDFSTITPTTEQPSTTITTDLPSSTTLSTDATQTITMKTTTTTASSLSSTTAAVKQTNGQVVTDLSQVDYSSMPISVTDDLMQLLCSTSPEWLIKTKLTDYQLLTAVKKRELKIRNYRQIFGYLVNKDVNNQQNNTITSNSRTTNSSSKLIPASFYLTLSETTVFVTAMGSTLYTQPLTDALSRVGKSQTSAELRSSGRYYLISGLGSANTTKSASVFVVLPNSRTPVVDSDSRGNFDIIKTYREFKLKGSNVCQQRQISSTPSEFLITTTTDGTTINTSTANGDQATTTAKAGRPRKHKKKTS